MCETRTDYNGWTNYATWKVSLEIMDDLDVRDFFEHKPTVVELADWCEEFVGELLGMDIRGNKSHSLTYAYAMSFLREVNWSEIAEHLLDYRFTNFCDDCENAFDETDITTWKHDHTIRLCENCTLERESYEERNN